MQMRAYPAEYGFRWINEGFALFKKNPIIWVALTLILFCVGLALSAIGVVGQLLFYLLSPVFLAGLIEGCRALSAGGELEIAHLFAGFRKNPVPLVTLGGIYAIGQVLIMGAMLFAGGEEMYSLFETSAEELDPQRVMEVLLLPLLVGAALSVPFMMALWFAPILVYLGEQSPLNSVAASFYACLTNFVPFLVYGAILLVLAFIAAIPFMLGFLVLIPVIVTSVYESYLDIFEPKSA
ncbi:MAG: BPSS1780 family membrane protein [Burkholderiales bacterium]